MVVSGKTIGWGNFDIDSRVFNTLGHFRLVGFSSALGKNPVFKTCFRAPESVTSAEAFPRPLRLRVVLGKLPPDCICPRKGRVRTVPVAASGGSRCAWQQPAEGNGQGDAWGAHRRRSASGLVRRIAWQLQVLAQGNLSEAGSPAGNSH